jgi:RNA polymerase sigma-70 factor (ECF subfamily)
MSEKTFVTLSRIVYIVIEVFCLISFEELCRENYNRIYKYIFAMTGNREAAEDLIQDVFTVAYEKDAAFLSHPNPPAFLYKTARNLTLAYLKRQKHHPELALDDSIPGDGGDLLEELLRARDRRVDETAYVGAVLDSLPPRQRALYDERYTSGRPIGELAVEQGVSDTALRMRLVRLRREIIQAVKALRLDER